MSFAVDSEFDSDSVTIGIMVFVMWYLYINCWSIVSLISARLSVLSSQYVEMLSRNSVVLFILLLISVMFTLFITSYVLVILSISFNLVFMLFVRLLYLVCFLYVSFKFFNVVLKLFICDCCWFTLSFMVVSCMFSNFEFSLGVFMFLLFTLVGVFV